MLGWFEVSNNKINETKLKKRNMNTEMDYGKLLETYSAVDLKAILKSWKVKGYSKLKKAELIVEIEKTVLENLKEKVKTFNNVHFEMLDLIALGKCGQVNNAEVVEDLLSLGIILNGKIHDRISYIIPSELSTLLRTLYKENMNTIKLNSVVIDYMDLALAVYGVISEDDLISSFTSSIENINIEELRVVLLENVKFTESVEYSDGFYYYFMLDEYKEVHKAAQNTTFEYKEITKEMLNDFMQNDKTYWTSGHDKMREAIGKLFDGDRSFALDIIDKYSVFSSYNYTFDSILGVFIKEFNLEKKERIDIFTEALIEVHNNVPHWLLKGGAPISVKKQPIVKDDKIGRNDPCPCGSNKKYKKCCLKK